MNKRDLENAVKKCVGFFGDSVDAVVLFGSRAKGSFSEESDFDVCIVGEFSLEEREKIYSFFPEEVLAKDLDFQNPRWKSKELSWIISVQGAKSPIEGLRKIKGQSLLVKAQNLTYKIPPLIKGKWLLPWADHLYLAGSTFEKVPYEFGPSKEGEGEILAFLHKSFPEAKWEVVERKWGERCTTENKRPIIRKKGRLLEISGLGSKGGFWASLLAPALARLIEENKAEANKAWESLKALGVELMIQ